ncbi:MAG: hydrogenase expression/formation protein HypE [Caldisericia bacterium]|jgi:hydrogenase expression/formation protein HypE|nr:hydrogenase expression/formation protein HypE [Caldisericia bacterium]
MNEKITLFHGSGGEGTKILIDKILKELNNEVLTELLDSAILNLKETIAFTTDSYVISPPFFKGGDIGKLSIFGTVNDLSVVGAEPLFLSLSLIIEEGFELSEFERIIASIKEASEIAKVKIVTGDTKVVEKGKGDKIFINTSGIGVIKENRNIRNRKIECGDLILINGGIGEHGLSIMLERLEVKIGDEVKSDLAPLNSLILPLLDNFKGIKFLRDPTRGGVATVLNEISKKFNFEIEIWEENLPIKNWVKEASNILGIDPLYTANEGKVILVVQRDEAKKVLEFLRNHPLGKDANIIGEVKGSGDKVYLKTEIGTRRILDTLKRDLLPRIC